ncbi:ZIP family metal transporter [Edaphocola flava]|uniref:ZIP family metal transporter n=1 Tax=Edaphocola flava TaxID=2499629 RepID=UPI00100B5653|nr:ZIP family metal transporter [Edaphocola flava]
MLLVYNILLFIITIIGGSIPLWTSSWSDKRMKNLLAFSGAYLLSITMLHLIPESVENVGFAAGGYMLLGYFLQQILQKFTHGVEHGHHHSTGHQHHLPIVSLFFGMALHAFAEGIPLGTTYHEDSTVPSLYLAIALHKLPEAMLLVSLLIHSHRSKNASLLWLCLFALLTPVSSMLTHYAGIQLISFASALPYIIAVVTGSFLQIGTTIFFESGSNAHDMSWRRWIVILAGIGMALLSVIGQGHDHVHTH